MRAQTYHTLDWKKYLIPNGNERIEKFLDSRGYDVFHQIVSNISRAKGKGWKKIVLLVHPNAGNVIVIPEKDYLQVLDIAMEWFRKNEYYEKCSHIVNVKNKLNTTINTKILETN